MFAKPLVPTFAPASRELFSHPEAGMNYCSSVTATPNELDFGLCDPKKDVELIIKIKCKP